MTTSLSSGGAPSTSGRGSARTTAEKARRGPPLGLCTWRPRRTGCKGARMESSVARRTHRTLEPYHGMIYFVPEARAAYEAIGLTGHRMGYFASRSAPMGAVPAEVVV